jgi:hypothetical protein
MYCYSNEGLSFRLVELSYVAQTGEALFNATPTADELASTFSGYEHAIAQADVKRQIDVIEATVTPRRMREAVAGTDGGWLAGINADIATLRSQLL